MAVPKKKVSKSRRNMRRFSTAYKLDPITTILDPETNLPVRPHSVSRLGLEKNVAAYVARKKAKLASQSTKA